VPEPYPLWIHYPLWKEPPRWAHQLVDVFRRHRKKIDSLDKTKAHLKSNDVLAVLAKDLKRMGFAVEGGRGSLIDRPVYFGECGRATRSYKIDSYNMDLKLGLEVEAGRATKGNAVYRDIVQTSLLSGVENFALAVPMDYSYGQRHLQLGAAPAAVQLRPAHRLLSPALIRAASPPPPPSPSRARAPSRTGATSTTS
jgi:hypothetical protein